MRAARFTLIASWSADQRPKLESLLAEISRDERIMAAAACDSDATLLGQTAGYPKRFGCRAIAAQFFPGSDPGKSRTESWHNVDSLPASDVLRSAGILPATQSREARTIHNLRDFVARREESRK